MTLKADLINGAFSMLKISGLTSSPTPEDNDLALDRLETMMHELLSKSVDIGYNFEDTPDINAPHNVERKYWSTLQNILAARMTPDYGITISAEFERTLRLAVSNLASMSARYKKVNPSTRHPVGSGNTTWNQFSSFYPQLESDSLSTPRHQMYVGDKDNFTESFSSYLQTGEDISSYTLTADVGLTVTGDSLSSPDITYTVEAVGSSPDLNETLSIVIVVTTSIGRKKTRVITFELTSI